MREELAVEARAHVADDVDDAMPVNGHTGDDQVRKVPGEVVRRSRGQRAARVKSGRRAGGRAERTSAIKVGLEIA